MNAIVSGKVEISGAKIFNSKISYDVSEVLDSALTYDCPSECNAIKVITQQFDETIIQFRKFNPQIIKPVVYIGTVACVVSAREDLVPSVATLYCYFDNRNKQLSFNISISNRSTTFKGYAQSIEIGTLE